ncbi:MAG TPA: DEAD/DEAH box helicase [Streptosporangiaceae bacterium]|nr:DEAD/DEAH box helicase [Streptosporangiaceae bacterium]
MPQPAERQPARRRAAARRHGGSAGQGGGPAGHGGKPASRGSTSRGSGSASHKPPSRGSASRGAGSASRGAAGQDSGPARPYRSAAGQNRQPQAPPRQGEDPDLDRALAAALGAPVPTAATFADLGVSAPLVTALTRAGVTAPFPIQAAAVPDAMAGRDVLGRAQTGSGKTLAFGLPMLARLTTPARPRKAKAPRGLVLVPTRELAVQVAAVLSPLAQAVGLRVATVYGGASIGRQIDKLARGVDVVVATPGRLIDLLDRSSCTLTAVEVTVIDEADYMADLGFLPSVTRIMDATPAGGQRMLFSATLDRGVGGLVRAYLSDPAIHAVAPAAAPVEAMDHRVFVLPASDRVAVAAEIAGRPARTLFFVRTKHGAARLAKQLNRTGIPSAALHGNLNQNQRQRALDAFAEGHPRVLVATNVAARGIHVDDVDLVVHFDPPNDGKDYLHRSGRTARAGAQGTVLALVSPDQVREVARLHEAIGVTPTSHHVQTGDNTVRQLAASGTPVPAAPRARTRAEHAQPTGQAPRPRTAGPAGPAPRRAQRSGGRPGQGRGNDRRDGQANNIAG